MKLPARSKFITYAIFSLTVVAWTGGISPLFGSATAAYYATLDNWCSEARRKSEASESKELLPSYIRIGTTKEGDERRNFCGAYDLEGQVKKDCALAFPELTFFLVCGINQSLCPAMKSISLIAVHKTTHAVLPVRDSTIFNNLLRNTKWKTFQEAAQLSRTIASLFTLQQDFLVVGKTTQTIDSKQWTITTTVKQSGGFLTHKITLVFSGTGEFKSCSVFDRYPDGKGGWIWGKLPNSR